MAIRKHLAGHVYIDAGLCIVGDPCVLRNFDGPAAAEPRSLDGRWEDVLARMPKAECEGDGAPSAGEMGFAVISTTGYGDGCYPVYAEIDDKEPGIVRRLTIDFVGCEQ